ncbi:hypothetical protein NPIL_547241 [Nephila pilipes]|uniref:Uncharacterized protein n=1 Tax=Nephila pilipes TaxID=299642 RepID=A0A8X6JA66_NEPPI|nr:hypothetical protein NPIL_547241 [Nephila pilipes]
MLFSSCHEIDHRDTPLLPEIRPRVATSADDQCLRHNVRGNRAAASSHLKYAFMYAIRRAVSFTTELRILPERWLQIHQTIFLCVCLTSQQKRERLDSGSSRGTSTGKRRKFALFTHDTHFDLQSNSVYVRLWREKKSIINNNT